MIPNGLDRVVDLIPGAGGFFGVSLILWIGNNKERKNSDGLEEIRTPDLRHVKATS